MTVKQQWETRLRRLEARRRRQQLTAMAAEVGLTVDELLEEAELFFALPLEEQLARVDEITEELRAQGFSTDDLDEMKDTLTREYRP
jgi:hypothetical protein